MVVKVGQKRVQIRVAQRVNGEWQEVTRFVRPERLSERTVIVPEVDGT
jgi:hypothetical protein